MNKKELVEAYSVLLRDDLETAFLDGNLLSPWKIQLLEQSSSRQGISQKMLIVSVFHSPILDYGIDCYKNTSYVGHLSDRIIDEKFPLVLTICDDIYPVWPWQKIYRQKLYAHCTIYNQKFLNYQTQLDSMNLVKTIPSDDLLVCMGVHHLLEGPTASLKHAHKIKTCINNYLFTRMKMPDH